VHVLVLTIEKPRRFFTIILQMVHDVWDSQRDRDINRYKDTVTDHRHKDHRYHSITGQAMIKDHQS